MFAKITAPVKVNELCIELDIFVIEDANFEYDLLIGRNAIQHPDIILVTDYLGSRLVRKSVTKSSFNVNLIQKDDQHFVMELASAISHLDQKLQDEIKAIFKKYPSILDDIGHVKTGELEIKLKKDEVFYYRPYRLAPIEREKVKEIVEDLLNKKIIKESNSSFASPMILVKKKDGSDRMCIDYRALNKLIEKDRYPLPLIDDQIDKLGNSTYYISIDMKNGFYQIPISSNSTKYTAFVTPDGHYEFVKMPFGICNGPSVFQRAITKAVGHLPFILVYIDDILIAFNTIEEGLSYLEQTISALSSCGFTVNLKKCKFFVDSIEYLGRQISREGVRPGESKINALANSPIPTNVKQVRQFMGLCSYFRKFIPDFASKTACITKLTKNNQKWEWGIEQDRARKYVIDHLTSKPLLTIFDPRCATELHTDASAIGYGAILLQKVGSVNKVVAYYSKRTSPAESKYCSYDLETLAIFNALKHFRVYLLGIKFTIITDCNAIKSTMTKKDLSPRVARWWTFMQDFQFDIQYKKGKFISHVDFLSRNPVSAPLERRHYHEVNFIEADNVSPESWLKIAQTNDSETQTLMSQLQAGNLDSNQYVIKNNLLHYKTSPDAEPRLFVPKGCRIKILKLFHDENCHVGFDKVLHKIRQYFWFPGIIAFIRKYINHCLICVQKKGFSGPKQGLLHPIDKTAVPFHTVHLDCTGPFPTTTEGFKHILLLVDGFTKFCLLKPLKTLSTGELIPIIRETVTLFGTPSLVVTDRGTNFSSNQIQALFRELNIEHHMIATGTPRGNGQVERYVATVVNMLNTMCEEPSDWPNVLIKVQQSINTTVQKSTGFTPLRLLIGVEANIPIVQSHLNEIINDEDLHPDIDVQADREIAKQRLQKIAESFKQRFDHVRRNNKQYNIGDLVYVSQDHRRNDKLKSRFKGPYEIQSILPNDRYALKGNGNVRNIVVAKEKLRFWPGEWVDEDSAVEHAI